MKWLENKMRTIGDWTSVTFPHQTATGKLCHLSEEIGELTEAIASGNAEDILAEYADCFILLIDSARAAGLSACDIDSAIENKMAVNKNRKWGEPDENGVCRHIK